jgi:hypothetical protein
MITVFNRVNFSVSLALICAQRDVSFISYGDMSVCVTLIFQSTDFPDWIRAGRSGDRIPVGARFFAHVQTGPGAHPAFCTMGTGSFPGGKAAGAWC